MKNLFKLIVAFLTVTALCSFSPNPSFNSADATPTLRIPPLQMDYDGGYSIGYRNGLRTEAENDLLKANQLYWQYEENYYNATNPNLKEFYKGLMDGIVDAWKDKRGPNFVFFL